MLGCVLYKERLKLKRGWLVLLAGNILALIYLYIEIRYLFRMDHAEIVWYRSIELGHINYSALRYIPLITALALAIMQFLPEMRDERLRLSLHLPTNTDHLILSHLLVGSFLLAIIMVISALGLGAIYRLYYPLEVVQVVLMTCAPWFLAGWCAYLGAALALLEPNLKLRIFNLILTAGLVWPLLEQVTPGAYAAAFPRLLWLPPILLIAVLLPAYHFRHRRVDR